jgi:PEP-CTERM/exosortase A-associated glycosyltransferase
MRILHVLDHSLPVQSGYAFRSDSILREQRALGWETVQLTSPKHGRYSAAEEQVDGLLFYRTPPASASWRGIPPLDQLVVVTQLRKRVREVASKVRPDIIHAHSPCLNGLATLGLGVPVIYEFRSSWEDAAVSTGTTTEGSLRYRLSRWLETRVLRGADAVTVICEGLRAEAATRGVPADRIAVIPNAVDPAKLDLRGSNPITARRRFGLTGTPIIGFIGSLFAWEGLDLLLRAMPRVLAERPGAQVLLAGGGPHETQLRALVPQLGLDGRVVFAGSVPHENVADVYAAIDLLVYPRARMRLTDMVTPLKPLEAMALGKAFVASDVGGHRELIRDGVTGVLFQAGNTEDLAGVILRVLRDDGLRARLGHNGQLHIVRERNWPTSVRHYAPLYEAVLRQRQRQGRGA